MLPLFDRNRSSPVALPANLTEALQRGATVLTGNVRAARALSAAYAEDQRVLAGTDGPVTWPTPPILDWKSWVAGLWEQHVRRVEDSPLPLGAMQEHQLWTQVQGSDRERVVAPERMAELAQEAYALLGDYQAHRLRSAALSGLFGSAHEDADRFLAWADSFDRLCDSHGWISRSRLEERLAQDAAGLRPPRELLLVGFDRITPAQRALLAACELTGTQVARADASSLSGDVPQSTSSPELLAFADPRAELEACAHWCRKLLAEGLTRRIAVIAPDPARLRGSIERIFRRVLMPQTTAWAEAADGPSNPPAGPPPAIFAGGAGTRSSPAEPPLPYEFSLGTPLAQLPVVRAALLVLRWVQAPLASAELTWLLTSGFLAPSAVDQLALARLDAELRQARDRTPQTALAWMVNPRRSRQLPGLLRERLHRVLAWAAREQIADNRRRTFAHWTELAAALLVEAGWPGFRTPDSVAYQARQRWDRLLSDLAELDFNGSQPSWREFLRLLEEEAAKVIFAAESLGPPIQILGAFESSGQSFDALWFLGADDQRWPPVGRPHPLLPLWLQRDAGMPHATPEADWLLAQEATRRVLASAPVVVLSHPLQEQGVALRASPLLPASRRPAAAHPPVAASESALAAIALDAVADHSGLIPWPAEQSAGGAEILQRQAACAFQSFATRRLEARPLEQAELGLDAAERGTLLHQVLERLWTTTPGDSFRLHDRTDLERATAENSLPAMLTHHIDAALATRATGTEVGTWHAAYLSCERERLLERLLAWLACELARQPFAVAALEQRMTAIHVGTLQLTVRPDRIDALADGSHLLLDYKTGKVKTSAWDGVRPREPQLPLYAIFGNVAQVSGVAFAQIRADETVLMARAADAAALVAPTLGSPSLKNRFDDEVRDEWKTSLEALAGQFVAGDARVNPRDGSKTCKWCPLAGLCRIHSLPTPGEDDENDEDDEA